MAGIGACTFYKKLVPCVPINNKDSEGSSDSGDCCENVEKASKSKKKVRKGCLVAIEDDSDSSDSSESSSDSSELRWKSNNVQDIVVPPSDHSSENMTTVSSTCISPMSNISSLVGSVTTLPPSPRSLSINEAPRRKPVSKEPVVSVQDRYTQKKPKEQFETQHVNKNVANVSCFPSKLPPVNPCRKMLFQGGSRPTIALLQSKKGASSNRARKLLEAASPSKLESCGSSAVNNPSPQKILAERKRTLKPPLNKENSGAIKPAIAAITPGITHSSSSSRSSIFSKKNNQIVIPENSKKNIDTVFKERGTDAVGRLEASSPRKPFSSVNSVGNLPSPQNILVPRKRQLPSLQNSSHNKENAKMLKASAASTPRISHTHSSDSSLSSTFSKTNNKVEISGNCDKPSQKDIPCPLPSKCDPTLNSFSFDGDVRQVAVVSSPLSPTRGQIASPGLSPITPGAATFPFLKKTDGNPTPPSETSGLLRKDVQSSIPQCNNTPAKESGQQENVVQGNNLSNNMPDALSSPDMFEELESPSVPANIPNGKSVQSEKLATLRENTLPTTDQANILTDAAKTNSSGIETSSKPSLARTSRNISTIKIVQNAARVDRISCASSSGSERNKESENNEAENQVHLISAPRNKKEGMQKKSQMKNHNLDSSKKITKQSQRIQSKNTSAKETGKQKNNVQGNDLSNNPPDVLSSPDVFDELESPLVPANIPKGRSVQSEKLVTSRGNTLSPTDQEDIQTAAAKTNNSGIENSSKPFQASISENTNTRKNPQRAARVVSDYCISPSASETNRESEDDVVELEHSEDDRQQNALPKKKKRNRKAIPEETQNGTKQKKTKNKQGKGHNKSKANQGNGQKKSKKVFVDQLWHEGDIPETGFPEEPEFSVPNDVKFPLEYFRYYFDDELIDMIVHETNLYTTQQSGKSICVTNDEILAFFGILIYMGVCSMPAAEDYWAINTRITQVCQVMSRNIFQQIHAKIHFHNNEEEGDDKLLKIRPLLDHMRQKCHEVEQEYKLSVDERMQGYKGTRAGSLRQFLPDKPSSRFGFKLFVLAGKSGMTYDFIPYTGQDTFDSEKLTDEVKALGVGAQAVISLCKFINNPACTTITIDNFYTGIPLLIYLRDKMNLNSVGTIKKSRTLKCPLTESEEILAKGRGSLESFVNKDGIVVMQWADNKAVCLASSFVGLQPISTAKRYSKDARAKIEVQCPRAVLKYNETMGGVDLADMFMGIYKIPTRARRYYFSFIGYSLELALTNSWLQYKRDCKLLKIPKKTQIDSSKKFRLEVSEDLKKLLLQSLGEPSLDQSLAKKKIIQPVVCRPNESLRTDGYKHLPKYCDKGRCRYCKNGTSRMKCTKCDVVLCFNKDRNCFTQFHITKKGELAPQDRVEQDAEDSDEEEVDEIDEENEEEIDEENAEEMDEVDEENNEENE